MALQPYPSSKRESPFDRGPLLGLLPLHNAPVRIDPRFLKKNFRSFRCPALVSPIP